jgi:hypothetical protein
MKRSKGPTNESAATGYTRIGGSWPDPAKQEIHLECPPGEPRPSDLLPALLKGTGLPVREDIGRLYGHWIWDYSDIPQNVWGAAVPVIERRMIRLFNTGIIRAGACSGFTSEDELGL